MSFEKGTMKKESRQMRSEARELKKNASLGAIRIQLATAKTDIEAGLRRVTEGNTFFDELINVVTAVKIMIKKAYSNRYISQEEYNDINNEIEELTAQVNSAKARATEAGLISPSEEDEKSFFHRLDYIKKKLE